MERLTLDTNVVRDLAWCKGDTTQRRYGDDEAKRSELKECFARLLALRDKGRCELGITTQVYTDYEGGPLPPAVQALIGPYLDIAVPATSTFPVAFPLVFADKGELERILKLVFPGIEPNHRNYHGAKKDALQLYAHKVAHRHFFITSDHAILAAEGRLLQECGIRVVTLGQYISLTGELPPADA